MARRNRDITIFGVAALIDAVGTGTFLAGSALYFTRTVGLSSSQIGVGVTVSALVGLAATVPWGHVAHRVGARPVYLGLLLARAACFAAYALVGSFPAYLFVVCLLGLVDKPTAPIQQELVGVVVGDADRQRALAWIRSTRNVGFALGSGVAALVSVAPVLGGYRSVVVVNAVSFVAAAALATRLSRPEAPSAARTAAPRKLTGLLEDRRYLAMTVANGVLTTHMTLLSVGLPLWIISATDLPELTVPLLFGVNTVLAVLLQVPVSARVDTTLSAARSLAVAGALLAACCVTAVLLPSVSGAPGVALAVVAVLFLTAAELVQSAGGWKLSFDLAPEHGRAVYLARFSLGTTVQTLVMPLVLTAVVFPAGALGWLVLGAVLAGVGAAAPRGAGVVPVPAR
ncbi:MFS transporter [Planotetraspora sp. A-T 1434]|uniref:MFS transporter n=1 Tax=Planotetraspora sp. A-T 1434 TaxID=2979219 RepID=UPI0021BF792E|nr:MFS transporter [Planotetraspora sp. A-T 1434]MCT9933586.1 MFS transporter [Planotetraspora sp. A-T 1434]